MPSERAKRVLYLKNTPAVACTQKSHDGDCKSAEELCENVYKNSEINFGFWAITFMTFKNASVDSRRGALTVH